MSFKQVTRDYEAVLKNQALLLKRIEDLEELLYELEERVTYEVVPSKNMVWDTDVWDMAREARLRRMFNH